MEYRKLPHGNESERFSVLGLGMGGIQQSSEDEIEAVICRAIDGGINYFDLCAGSEKVYAPFGRAISGRRGQVFTQLHFGAVYNSSGDYAWSRDAGVIKETFDREMHALFGENAKSNPDFYTDFGFLHCVDENDDLDLLISSGVLDLIKGLKADGLVRRIGFSSHTPSTANRILDMGIADMMMFSINPAYDYERGDEYGRGSVSERARLFRRCETEGVGISVMKPFLAGQLLDEKTSPFRRALSLAQCIRYALDRPGVLTVLPGVRGIADLEALLDAVNTDASESDYSVLGSLTSDIADGSCVYCNHCQPCPAGIDIGLVNKYYDLALSGDALAVSHYDKLSVKADSCLKCGHCTGRCPFRVDQQSRMESIAEYFSDKE